MQTMQRLMVGTCIAITCILCMPCITLQSAGIKERDVLVKLFILFSKVQELNVIWLLFVLKNKKKLDHRLLASKDSYGPNFKIWADLKTENKNKKFQSNFSI